jgi:hypothetical protein
MAGLPGGKALTNAGSGHEGQLASCRTAFDTGPIHILSLVNLGRCLPPSVTEISDADELEESVESSLRHPNRLTSSRSMPAPEESSASASSSASWAASSSAASSSSSAAS